LTVTLREGSGQRLNAAEELIAELGAAFLAAEFSFDGDVRHAGYIETWIGLLRNGLVEPRRMVQVGLRSPVEREVHDWTLARGVTMITAQDVHEQDPAAIAERVRQVIGGAPVYLSFDIDVLDPAFAPGTGTPQIGGLASWQAQAIMRRLGGLQFIGMDVVEVCPAYDVAEITALAGATIAWEYLCMLGVPAVE
jgi:arginase family enzyme